MFGINNKIRLINKKIGNLKKSSIFLFINIQIVENLIFL